LVEPGAWRKFLELSARLVPKRLREPLGEPSFRRLVAGKSVSYLGDWLMVAALVGWVYETTASVTQVALLMAIRLVPPIAGGGLAAAVVDRFPRTRVLVASEAACAVTVAGALVGVLVGSTPLVFAFVGACGLLSMVSNVAGTALVPMLAEDERLAAANGVYGVAQEAAMACGALLGGVAMAAGGAALALALNLVSYAVAVALYARIRVLRPIEPRQETRESRGLLEGVRYLMARRTLLVVVCSFALATVATGLTNATLPRFMEALGLGPGGYGYGLAALALGLMLGEAATGAVAERVEARWLAPALSFMAVGFVGLAWCDNGVAALLLLLGIGLADGVSEVVLNTSIQQDAEREYHGRIFGLGSSIWRTTMLGAVAAAPLVNAVATPAQAISIAATFLVAGAAAIGAATRSMGVAYQTLRSSSSI
jgi:MFS family permease